MRDLSRGLLRRREIFHEVERPIRSAFRLSTPTRGLSRHCRHPALPLLSLGAALLGFACAAQAPRPVDLDLAAFQGVVTPVALLPLSAEGAVRLTYRDETESGDVLLEAGRGFEFRMRLRARLTGAVALEVRFGPERMLVLDPSAETYFMGQNSPDNRKRLFGLDISPVEFLMILTGRISGPTEGTPLAAGTASPLAAHLGGRHAARTVAFPMTGDATGSSGSGASGRYVFALDEHGLPKNWIKEVHGKAVFRVEYREYMNVPGSGGTVLRLPRKVRVYGDDPRPMLVLGLREVRPFGAGPPPISFDPPTGGAWRFTPLPPREN